MALVYPVMYSVADKCSCGTIYYSRQDNRGLGSSIDSTCKGCRYKQQKTTMYRHIGFSLNRLRLTKHSPEKRDRENA